MIELLKKCQKCHCLKETRCYGTRKGHRTGYCEIKFQEDRRKWIANLPTPDKIGNSFIDKFADDSTKYHV